MENQARKDKAFEKAMAIFDCLYCQGCLTNEELEIVEDIEKDYWRDTDDTECYGEEGT